MKTVLTVGGLAPEFGGPSRSIPALAEALDADHVVALDQACGDAVETDGGRGCQQFSQWRLTRQKEGTIAGDGMLHPLGGGGEVGEDDAVYAAADQGGHRPGELMPTAPAAGIAGIAGIELKLEKELAGTPGLAHLQVDVKQRAYAADVTQTMRNGPLARSMAANIGTAG